MRVVVAILVSAVVALGLAWLGTRLFAPPAATTPPAQAAVAAKADRKYDVLVRRLRANARRAQRITAARGAWARRADRICGSTLRTFEATTRAAAPVKTRTQLLALFSKLEPIEADYLGQLRALPTPRHDAAKVQKMLELTAQELAINNDAVAAFRRNDQAGFLRLLKQELRLGARTDAIAAALGAAVCAQDSFSGDQSR